MDQVIVETKTGLRLLEIQVKFLAEFMNLLMVLQIRLNRLLYHQLMFQQQQNKYHYP